VTQNIFPTSLLICHKLFRSSVGGDIVVKLPGASMAPRDALPSSLTSPSKGQDTVYDGAADMRSTAHLFGPRGTPYSVGQCYGAAFKSKTPRPWEKPVKNKFPVLGPGQYDPHKDTHVLASSMSWQSRGRSGPVGHPFDGSRTSLPFSTSTTRFGETASSAAKRGPFRSEDLFITASDARRDSLVRAGFSDRLQNRFLTAGFPQQQMGLQPLMRAATPGPRPM
jgi:hypothetical protein